MFHFEFGDENNRKSERKESLDKDTFNFNTTVNQKEGDDPEKIGAPMPQFYAEAVRRCKAAMRFGPLKGILWHQGEGDRSQALRETYMERLGKLVSDLRQDLGVGEEVPFVLGETFHGGIGTPVNPTLAQVGYFIPNSLKNS